jgi:hypothetical protein
MQTRKNPGNGGVNKKKYVELNPTEQTEDVLGK